MDLFQIVCDESRQRDLFLDDEEEDFLDECIVNPTGSIETYAAPNIPIVYSESSDN